jgi:hypothetical protein
LTRRGARAVTLTAFALAIVVGVEAAARAQQAGGQSEIPDPVIPIGVTVSGVAVGGLTADQAERALSPVLAPPVTVTYHRHSWRYVPETLGATAQVESAVVEALGAPPNSSLRLGVEINRAKLDRWSRSFARSFDREARDAAIVLHGDRPVVKRERFGRQLTRWAASLAVINALDDPERAPVELPVRILRPDRTAEDVGLAIVIKRASNRLILYHPGGSKGMRIKRRFGVATGQAAYPTPLGDYEIATKQRNPWWRPPDSDWAEGAEPIPPGPGNPLGTRWMGLSAPAVGIHGTPDAASIGYSASHGCIRMLVPQAEWLFERVQVGTPVYIIDA